MYCRQQINITEPITKDDLDSVHWYGVRQFDSTEEIDRRLEEAEIVLKHELGEDMWFYGQERVFAMVFIKAWELIEKEEELVPAVKQELMKRIFDETVWADAGYKDVQTWFAAEGKTKKGGQLSDYIFISETLIPYCEQTGVATPQYFAPKLTDKGEVVSVVSKLRLPGVIPLLREALDEHGEQQLAIAQSDENQNVIQEQLEKLSHDTAVVVSNVLNLVTDETTSRTDKVREITQLRDGRALIRVYKNGNITLLPTVLTQRQYKSALRMAGPFTFEEIELEESGGYNIVADWLNTVKGWFGG